MAYPIYSQREINPDYLIMTKKSANDPVLNWLEDLLKNSAEDSSSGLFDDDLPKRGTPLRRVMESNGILTSDQRARYETYDSANPGCSPDNPIMIEETDGYVHLEYELLEFILRPAPYRFVDYKVEKQSLVQVGDRHLDSLKVRIYSHPIMHQDADGKFVIPEPEFLGTEEYWFDITAGYNARAI